MALLSSVAAAVLIAGANYADYATTRDAIGRGAWEMNPIYGIRGERLAPIKIGVVAAETAAFVLIERRHRKAAWIYAATIVGANLLIAHHNAKVMR